MEKVLAIRFETVANVTIGANRPYIALKTPVIGSMSSIKRDVKKKLLPRPEGEVSVSRSSPL